VSGGLLLGKIYEEAGLPAGVLNVLIAKGSTIGDAFVRHPVPRVVSFTGSTEVGRRIMDLAAESPIIKRVLLELGGNCPCVVLADADLDLAVRGAVFGKFLHQGQICMAINRLIVDASIHDEFVDRFKARVSRLKCGTRRSPIRPLVRSSTGSSCSGCSSASSRRAQRERGRSSAARRRSRASAARLRRRDQRHVRRCRGAVRPRGRRHQGPWRGRCAACGE
jgi:acyl-CoA reductase-like NAD-dependent aldehyde dehydrogenase